MADVNIDNIWSAVGHFGRYQRKNTVYYSLSMSGVACGILVYVFVGYRPPYSCKLPANGSWLNDSLNESRTNFKLVENACGISVVRNNTNVTGNDVTASLQCGSGYNYDISQDTIVSEWNLVCSDEGKSEFTQSLVTIGQTVGALFFLPLADRFGRKRIYYIMGILLLLSNTLISLSPNYPVYAFMKFLSGAFIEGYGMVFFTYIYEMFPGKYRTLISVFGAFWWTTNVMIITAFGYGLRNYSWRYLHLATGCVCVFNLFTYWLCDESLRWLLANGKTEEATKLLQHICKENKKDPAKILPLMTTTQNVELQNDNTVYKIQDADLNRTEFQHSDTSADTTDKASLVDVFRHKFLLKITLIWLFTWFTNSVTYYGLLLSSVQLEGNRFLNFFVNGVVEMPSNILFLLLINRVKRRTLTIGFHLLAGIPMIISVILITFKDKHESLKTLAIVCSFIGKMGITGSYNTIFIYVPETYPTNLRNIGLGLASAASHIGGIVAPFSSLLAHHVEWGPGVAFGVCCLIVSCLCAFLPTGYNVTLEKQNFGSSSSLTCGTALSSTVHPANHIGFTFQQ